MARQASGAAAEIGAVESRNACWSHAQRPRKTAAGEKERHGRGKIDAVSRKKFAQRHCSETGTWRTISSTTNDSQRHSHAQARCQSARFDACQPRLQQIGEYAASAETEQRDRNREKCEVVEEHDRE